MLRSLLVLGALAGAAHAETRTYDVRAVRVHPTGDARSCGAAKRMLRDKHVLRIDDETGEVRVNGFKWRTFNPDPDLIIDFHTADRFGVHQKTSLVMDLYVNQRGLSGVYILKGVTLGGKRCVDAVFLDGTRR